MSPLSNEDRRRLLAIARQSIVAAISQSKLPTAEFAVGALAEFRGAFVTLHRRGRLRGCVGQPGEYDSLADTVARCAALAATEDNRFRPVAPEEFSELEIEISVLSPMQPVHPDEIQLGIHGLMISSGSARGVLLPQVPIEHRLTREQFLSETCRKAGLPVDAWKSPGAEILGFTCEVFSDREPDTPAVPYHSQVSPQK
jgi:AmmeMemoRadiSam system protein A